MVREAVLLTVESMVHSGKFSVGHLVYAANPQYSDFDSWFMIDIDLADSVPPLLLRKRNFH